MDVEFHPNPNLISSATKSGINLFTLKVLNGIMLLQKEMFGALFIIASLMASVLNRVAR